MEQEQPLRQRITEGRLNEIEKAKTTKYLPPPALVNQVTNRDLEQRGHAQHPPELVGPDPWGQ